MTHELPTAVAALDRMMHEGLHIGWQLYASVAGRVVADVAGGEARPGVAMTPDTSMVWFSATKAVTSVAAAQQWERGGFDLDDPVAIHIPEFASKGKGAITIRHLFTHTAGIRQADVGGGGPAALVPGASGYSPFVSPWSERLARIVDAEIEDGWVPGRRAGYHPFSGMFLLAEIVQRLDGRPFSQYVRDEIFEPLGMHDCWMGMPSERFHAYGDRIGVLHLTRPGRDPMAFPRIDTEEGCTACTPGAAGRGPMRELARFYEAMLGKGARDGVRLVGTTTAEAMVARHRVGMHDETFGIVIDWGLGFILDSVNYGRHCSTRTFGHGGGQSSVAFADPEHGLTVAVVMNGLPGPQAHYRRLSEITADIYEDLGLAAPDDPGREHAVPTSGLQ
ncbi:MAG TPA: serine hydrolase domain-containing protein [Acidimicrobiales bacterium]|nr:serine hydrolase domain-containing protein [Acidimicrobiales bacterium]